MNIAVNNFSKKTWFMSLVIRYENVFRLRNVQYLPWYDEPLRIWWAFKVKDALMVHKNNSVRIQLGFPA